MAKWHVSRSPNDPELWAVFSDAGYLVSDNLPIEDAVLIAASPTLLEALEQIQHSIKQAMIPGNDWRRELQLIANTADAAITLATGKDA